MMSLSSGPSMWEVITDSMNSVLLCLQFRFTFGAGAPQGMVLDSWVPHISGSSLGLLSTEWLYLCLFLFLLTRAYLLLFWAAPVSMERLLGEMKLS
jgi:hypothetical protein